MTALLEQPGFEHEALFYRGEEDFLADLVPFVLEGLAREEAVLVAEPRSRLDLLRDALADDARTVSFLDMEEVGANPARILGLWAAALEEQTRVGRTLRGVGEPAWYGRREAELVESGLHEQLLNRAFDDGPAWRLLCPYDEERLPRAVCDTAVRTHPLLWTGAGRAINEDYRPDGDAVAAVLPRPPGPGLRGPHGPPDGGAARRRRVRRRAAPPGGAGAARPLRPLRRPRAPPHRRAVRPLVRPDRRTGRGVDTRGLGAGHEQHPARRRGRDGCDVGRARCRRRGVQRRRSRAGPVHRTAPASAGHGKRPGPVPGQPALRPGAAPLVPGWHHGAHHDLAVTGMVPDGGWAWTCGDAPDAAGRPSGTVAGHPPPSPPLRCSPAARSDYARVASHSRRAWQGSALPPGLTLEPPPGRVTDR